MAFNVLLKKLRCTSPLLLVVVQLLQILQAQPSDEGLKAILDKSGLKDFEKSQEKMVEADELLAEANGYFIQLYELLASEDTSEKSVKKDIEKLEQKAAKQQLKAFGTFKEGFDAQYNLFKNELQNFWTQFGTDGDGLTEAREGEQMATELISSAERAEIDAEKMPEVQKASMLMEAYNTYKLGLNELKHSLSIVYGIETDSARKGQQNIYTDESISDTGESAPTAFTPVKTEIDFENTIPDSVLVNDELLDIYFRLKDDKSYDLTDSLRNYYSAGFNWNQIQNRWVSYIEATESKTATGTPLPEYKEPTEEDYPEVMNPGANVVVDQVNTENKQYYIKFPADRPLNQNTLQRLYYGGKEIKVKRAANGYVYSIELFNSFDEAEQYKYIVGLEEGVILALNNNEYSTFLDLSSLNQNAPETKNNQYPEEHTATINETTATHLPLATENILFYVQIASSDVPLTIKYLNEIYKGSNSIYVRHEPNGYKYQIGGTKFFHKAKLLLDNCGAHDAFLVAYGNGDQRNILRAQERMDAVLKNTLPKDMQFYVQIATSREPISQNTIKRIYQGPFPVSTVIEGGWYKYHIMAGHTYENAKNIQDKVNIKEAFIVGYANGVKKLLY